MQTDLISIDLRLEDWRIEEIDFMDRLNFFYQDLRMAIVDTSEATIRRIKMDWNLL
jgi:hypothetical protein